MAERDVEDRAKGVQDSEAHAPPEREDKRASTTSELAEISRIMGLMAEEEEELEPEESWAVATTTGGLGPRHRRRICLRRRVPPRPGVECVDDVGDLEDSGSHGRGGGVRAGGVLGGGDNDGWFGTSKPMPTPTPPLPPPSCSPQPGAKSSCSVSPLQRRERTAGTADRGDRGERSSARAGPPPT
ncbi:hypothetical protein BT93_E2868 [Corymbia citriodora subsp. variegata]|nr:hypothetical protein BT93_E2868 [Corymbia citriodora subsp. variegata]